MKLLLWFKFLFLSSSIECVPSAFDNHDESISFDYSKAIRSSLEYLLEKMNCKHLNIYSTQLTHTAYIF